jgi:hypothetical protein
MTKKSPQQNLLFRITKLRWAQQHLKEQLMHLKHTNLNSKQLSKQRYKPHPQEKGFTQMK